MSYSIGHPDPAAPPVTCLHRMPDTGVLYDGAYYVAKGVYYLFSWAIPSGGKLDKEKAADDAEAKPFL